MSPTYETALGVRPGDGTSENEAAAGATSTLLVVADGHGGHVTGWLPARLAARTVGERFAADGEAPRFVGVADEYPESWGWSGALRDRGDADEVYRASEALLELRAAPTLVEALLDLDRAVARIPELPYRFHGPLASCTAVRADGEQVLGAHVGLGRALLLRAGSGRLEPLTQEHDLREAARRAAVLDDDAIAELPDNVLVGALGGAGTLGVDAFTTEVAVGDVLLLCSRRLPFTDDALAELLQRALASQGSLADVVRALVRAPASDGYKDICLAALRRRA